VDHRGLVSTIVALLALVPVLAPAQVLWGPEQQITTHSRWSYVGYNNARCVASQGDEVHVLWADNRYLLSANEILYRRSTDDGASWEELVRLSNDAANSDYPSLGVSGSEVHAVWQDDRDGNSEIYYSQSVDSGVSWGPELRLTDDPAASRFCSIAASDPFVYVVWEDTRHGATEIYFKRSGDSGTTWEPDVRLTEASGTSSFPSITQDGVNLYVVWHDRRDSNTEVYLKRSTDAGTSWGVDARLTNDPARSENPSLTVDGSNLFLAWTDRRDDTTFEVYHKGSTDSGASWGSTARLSHALGESYNPSIAAAGDHVLVLWHDERDGGPDIYYAGSTDGRNTHELELADVVLAGVSRVGKTPLSMYLAMLGWKAANVPLVKDIEPPPQLFEIDRKRVVGLTIMPERLRSHRRLRERSLGAVGALAYSRAGEITQELEFARAIFRRGRFTAVDISDKPIEETANEVIANLERK